MSEYLKRLSDILISFFFLIIFSPVFLIIAGLIRIKLGSPIMFKQKRPGLQGRLFYLYKFRSMTEERDENGLLLLNEFRLTRFGKILRKFSLDELPQLWNVLKGDMSIVGPRPLLKEYLHLYDNLQSRRHEVRPGITGLAQVNGRNAISWEQKFEYDVWYVDHRSLGLDIKILFLTAFKVIKSDGINQQAHVTMTKFQGNSCKTKDFDEEEDI